MRQIILSWLVRYRPQLVEDNDLVDAEWPEFRRVIKEAFDCDLGIYPDDANPFKVQGCLRRIERSETPKPL